MACALVNAVVSETLRYACPVPLGTHRAGACLVGVGSKGIIVSGLPHRLTEDDVYEDMHIPKGSFALANIWYAKLAPHSLNRC